MSLLKNSFTLLETILSVLVLSIMLVNFGSLYSNNKNLDELFVHLNELENKFNKNEFHENEFTKESNHVDIIIDNNQANPKSLQINYTVYKHNKENINLEKMILEK